MSGPVRPSEDAVLEVIQALRRQFPDAVISLFTWTSPNTLRLRNSVEHFFEAPEPPNSLIIQQIPARTVQQRQLGLSDETPGCKCSLYKMMFGVQCLCDAVSSYVRDDDIVLRIRTDSMLLLKPDYIPELMSNAAHFYIARKGDGFDWFGLTTFRTLKQVWCFGSLQEYNEHVNRSWNPENVVQGRIRVPIVHLDPQRAEYYILRENGRKNYYP